MSKAREHLAGLIWRGTEGLSNRNVNDIADLILTAISKGEIEGIRACEEAVRIPNGDMRCKHNNGKDCWVDPVDPEQSCYGIENCDHGCFITLEDLDNAEGKEQG